MPLAGGIEPVTATPKKDGVSEVVKPDTFACGIVPVEIVPRVVMLADPPHVDKAVFSTLFKLRFVFAPAAVADPVPPDETGKGFVNVAPKNVAVSDVVNPVIAACGWLFAASRFARL